ncbi:MAG: hypothetical protein JWM99_696 [Verrucomicrobiales bacterium]|nr:hypothetical protein [Verrucomicrobiales bacterium]
MNGSSDQQLLRDYGECRSEPAFAELVRRYVDFVFSVALRIVRDRHLAEDVTQNAFLALAENSEKLSTVSALSGWLHRTTRNIALNAVRTDVRRRIREQEAVAMNISAAADLTWEEISPHLDAALDQLKCSDRDVVLLRFIHGKSAAEIAKIISVSDVTAQKRLNRAIDRLRNCFKKRGLTVAAPVLFLILPAKAIQAAPSGLAITITTALFGGAIRSAAILGTCKAITMTTTQKTLVVLSLAAALGTGLYQIRQSSSRQKDALLYRQQLARVSQDLQESQQARDAARQSLLATERANDQLRRQAAEVYKLRAEVSQLRAAEGTVATTSPMKTLVNQVALLKQKLDQMPDRRIPEIEFATEKDWVNAVSGADLRTEDGVREALSKLREGTENIFLNEMMKTAIKKYLATNDYQLPSDLSKLKPYFDVPVSDAMLQRYQLLQNGKPDNAADLVKLTTFVDDEHDSTHAMSINGAWGSSFNKVQEVIQMAALAFASENGGQMPSEPSQLANYLTKPVDAATTQKYLEKIIADPPTAEVVTVAPALKAYSDTHNGALPRNPSDLRPYITTPEQMAALEKQEGNSKPISK